MSSDLDYKTLRSSNNSNSNSNTIVTFRNGNETDTSVNRNNNKVKNGNTIRRTYRRFNNNSSKDVNSEKDMISSDITSNNSNSNNRSLSGNNRYNSKQKQPRQQLTNSQTQIKSSSTTSKTSVNQWNVSPNLVNSGVPLTTTTTTSTTITPNHNNTEQAVEKKRELPVLLTVEKYKELVQKYNIESDSDDSFDDNSDNSDNSDNDTQYDKIFENYNRSGSNLSLSQSSQPDEQAREMNIKRLMKETSRGSSSCMVCLERVKPADSIWQCSHCFCFLHLGCTQSWARERLLISAASEACQSRGQLPSWLCPNCRHQYHREDAPTCYKCFCGKVIDPPVDHWLVPHTCGEICGRKLNGCTHTCTLLCHPAACLPCSRTVQANCHCGRESKVQRCKDGLSYSCEHQCGKQLVCKHLCESNCHSGIHPPCSKTSIKKCRCGRMNKETVCSDNYVCDSVCNKILACGKHKCTKVCCDGCEPCELTGKRICGCGTKEYVLDCSVPTPKSCGSTCNKQLSCAHKCFNRCHYGECSSCNQVTKKKCRCGSVVKDMPCSKELICTSKCNNMRNCGRHRCRKTCCDGQNCPTCEQECGEKLSCGNHRCTAYCHKGACLPCNLTVRIYCACKSTYKDVLCGTEKKTQPPRCSRLCTNPTTCHHSRRRRHKCHFGPCQPCNYICSAPLPGCSHFCPKDCHDPIPNINYRLKPILEYKGQTIQTIPKEKAVQFPPQLPISSVKCDACKVPVQRQCIGEHESKFIECSGETTYSCDTKCGNLLECGNHYCQGKCHKVTIRRQLIKEGNEDIVEESYEDIDNGEDDDNENAGGDGASMETVHDNCQVCKLGCQNPRPKGCTHECGYMACHLNECPTCEKNVKVSCHCKSNTLLVPCFQYIEPEKVGRDIFSCGNVCRRFLDGCTHSCPLVCHDGPCSECKASLNVYCRCKTRKERWTCKEAKEYRAKNNITNSDKLLSCNDSCPTKSKKDDEEVTPMVGTPPEEKSTLTKEQKRMRYKEKQDEQAKIWKQQELEIEKGKEKFLTPKLIFRITIAVLIISFVSFLLFATNLK